jgi:hypothetical protein
MRATRDRQILVWTMAAIGIGSLLAGAAMQTEPLRSLCGCGTMAQAGSSEDCVQDRMTEAMARAQLAASGRAPQADRPKVGDSIRHSVENAGVPAPKSPTQLPVPVPPSAPRDPEPPKP